MIIASLLLLIQYTLIFASVLILVALGGCFSEHSGVINLGLEGIMVIGAMGGALTMKVLPQSMPGFFIVLITLIVSLVVGVLYSSLLGVASIQFKADQTIVGTALNMLGTAVATVIVKAINNAESMALTGSVSQSSAVQYNTPKSNFIVNMNFGSNGNSVARFELNWFMIITLIILALAFIVLYKTKFGLRLMACGEHPQAAASVGISVLKMRWAGVLISGALGGLGGICYIMAGVSEWRFENGVVGFGFLALAVMIFGQWKPQRIALAALLFGFLRALGNLYSSFNLLKNLNLPSAVYNMLPYIICLVVLALTSKNSKAPKAEGIPYDASTR